MDIDNLMKTLAAPLLCSVLTCLSFTGISANASARYDVDATVATDTVDIGLSLNQLERTTIYDDEVLRQTATITNQASACWVRISGTEQIEDDDRQIDDLEALDGVAWVKGSDGCFYRTEPLGEDAAISVDLPISNLWNAYGFDMDLTVTAEAIQLANMSPDFEADLPWGQVTAEACVNARTGSSPAAERDGEES